MRKIIYLFASLLFSCAHSPSEKTDQLHVILLELENQILNDLEKDALGGSISAALVKGDSIVWSKAFGYSNADTHTPADTATIYRAGSISKSFTSFLMMKLIEEGIIHLDDPVERYVPEIRNVKGYSGETKITLRQLSNHTAGLPTEPELAGAAKGPIETWKDKLLASLPKTTLKNRPGEKFQYSNIGYGILGLALERAAGKPFTKLMHEKVFVPLRMHRTYYAVPDTSLHQLAAGIDNVSSERPDTQTPLVEHKGRGYKVPNGGLYTTPNDLARFMICNLGYAPKIVSSKSLALMHLENQDGENSYGLGFITFRNDKMFIVGHSGAVSGYEAQFLFDKKSQYGFIMMRNYNQGATNLERLQFDLISKLRTR